MVTKQIEDFDPTPYLTIPGTSANELLTLAEVLVALQPKGDWPSVQVAAKRIAEAVDEGESINVARIRNGPGYTRADVKFDGYVDGLWGLFRDRLAGWLRYQGEGRERLAQDEELEINLDELEARADRAAEVLDQLFPDGLEFLRRSYNVQSQLMNTVLEAIEAEGLTGQLIELTGEELLPVLKACQRRYKAMVTRRLSRDKNAKIGDLNQLKGRLQRGITLYVNAVIGTLSAPEPNTVESVEAALLPIVNVRLGRSILLGRRADDQEDAEKLGELGDVDEGVEDGVEADVET